MTPAGTPSQPSPATPPDAPLPGVTRAPARRRPRLTWQRALAAALPSAALAGGVSVWLGAVWPVLGAGVLGGIALAAARRRDLAVAAREAALRRLARHTELGRDPRTRGHAGLDWMLLVSDQHAQIALHAHGRWQLLPAHRAWLSRTGGRLRVEVAGRSLHLAGDHPAAATLRAALRRPAADRPGAGRPSVAVAPLRRIARRLRAHPAVRAEGPYPLPRRTALTHAPADRDPNGATPREPRPTRAGTDVPAR